MMQQWEYLILELRPKVGGLVTLRLLYWYWHDRPDVHYKAQDGRHPALERLQSLGREGWELTSTTAVNPTRGHDSGLSTYTEYVFKRALM